MRLDDVLRKLRELEIRIFGLIRKSRLTGINNDAGLQVGQTEGGDSIVSDDVEIYEQYGFTSKPPLRSGGLEFRIGGDSGRVVGILYGGHGRPDDVGDGEVCIWHKSGSKIVFRDDGSIALVPANGSKVHIGEEPGASEIARADRVDAELDKLRTHANSHIHTAPMGNTSSANAPAEAAGPTASDLGMVS